jgi:hypothetical protein
MCSQEQRPLERQKQHDSTRLENNLQINGPVHVVQGVEEEAATIPSPEPDHVSMCEDREQTLNELRAQVRPGGRPPLTRRLGFLR